MLQDNFVCIGNGQCGGNMLIPFEKKGYRTLAINTSGKDLQTLKIKFKYHIEGAEGCAKDRTLAMKLVEKNYKDIIDAIIDKVHDTSHILMFTSTGGGSGSGITPILADMIKDIYPKKIVSIIAVLPSTKETLQAQYNTIKFFNEISKANNLDSIFVLDNENNEMFEVNNIFHELFEDVFDIPNHISIKGNIDESEIMDMFGVAGCSIIAKIPKSDDSVESEIIKSWKEAKIFAPIDFNKEIKRLAVSTTCDIKVYDLIKEVGTPIKINIGYNPNHNITMLSGLSLPNKRLAKINGIACENKEIFQKDKSHKINFNLDIDWMNEVDVPEPKKAVNDNIEVNLKDVLAKWRK